MPTPSPAMPNCPFCSRQVPDNSSVCPHCLRAQPVTIPTTGRSGPASRAVSGVPWKLLLLAVVAVALGGYAFRQRHAILGSLPSHQGPVADTTAPSIVAPLEPVQNTPQVSSNVVPPVDVRIADSASAHVASNAYLLFPFSGGDRAECKLHGTVHVLSGGALDVFIVDGLGADDLAHGRVPRKYYESGGVTDATLDAGLDGRSNYSLIVSNLGAGSRPKTVRLKDVGARCADL